MFDCSWLDVCAQYFLGGFPTGLGDPTLPDILLPISFLGFLIAAIKKYISRLLRTRNIRILSHSLINVFAFLLILSLVDIVSRHFGTWGQIKSELIALDIAIKKFEQKNGVINNKEKEAAFLSIYPLRSFKLNGDKVYINFWDSDTKPRVGVSWDGGGNARFDLQTMYVVYTD